MSTENTSETQVESTPVTVTLEEPAANDNGETNATETETESQGAAAPGDAARPTRKERRANDLRTERQAREAAEQRLQTVIEEARSTREALAELRGRQHQMFLQQAQQAGDPVERQVTELEAKAERHLAHAATAAQNRDEATRQSEMREYHKANRDAAVLEARRHMEAEFRRFGQSQPDPEMAGMKVNLASEFPWLSSNDSARRAADGYIGVLMAKGRPNNLATFREACSMAARDFSLGGAPERPSDARRAAYGGVPSREGGGDDGRTTLRMEGNVSESIGKMATQLFPNLEPEEARKRWLREIGPGLARK